MKHNITTQWMSLNKAALAVGLLVSLAPLSRAGMFTGDFAPANWALSPLSSNPGTFAFSGAGNAEILTVTSSTTPGASVTLVALSAPYSTQPGTLNFNWSLAQIGNNGIPAAFFYVGANTYDLLGGAGSLMNIPIPANTPLGFGLVGDLVPGKDPAQLEINNWDITLVPEPGPIVTGALTAALSGLVMWRRSRKAGANSSQV